MNILSQSSLAACAVFVLTASAAHAETEPTALVDQQHCMFCHTRDAPFLAPSFQQIAERYRDAPNAQFMLEHKLRLGGKAHWGTWQCHCQLIAAARCRRKMRIR